MAEIIQKIITELRIRADQLENAKDLKEQFMIVASISGYIQQEAEMISILRDQEDGHGY